MGDIPYLLIEENLRIDQLGWQVLRIAAFIWHGRHTSWVPIQRFSCRRPPTAWRSFFGLPPCLASLPRFFLYIRGQSLLLGAHSVRQTYNARCVSPYWRPFSPCACEGGTIAQSSCCRVYRTSACRPSFSSPRGLSPTSRSSSLTLWCTLRPRSDGDHDSTWEASLS